MKEGLGYTLQNYDPCFNFNADRFCCSDRNVQLYRNLALSQAPAQQQLQMMAKSVNYTAPRNVGSNDSRFNLQLAGLAQNSNYTFPAIDSWNVPCSRMPCGIYANKLPCKRV